jgi:hypothetical protein
MPLASKITIMAYIGTYYALGSAWVLTMLNYFLVGFFNGWLDHYYIDSFRGASLHNPLSHFPYFHVSCTNIC